MNGVLLRARTVISHLLVRSPTTTTALPAAKGGGGEQRRGIRVKVMNGNLDAALRFMEKKMRWSGIERMIKKEQTHHIKNSEKKQLAIKRVQFRARSEGIARIYQSILIKKVSFRMFVLLMIP